MPSKPSRLCSVSYTRLALEFGLDRRSIRTLTMQLAMRWAKDWLGEDFKEIVKVLTVWHVVANLEVTV